MTTQYLEMRDMEEEDTEEDMEEEDTRMTTQQEDVWT